MEIQTKNEMQRIQDKYNEIKQELDLKNEKLLKKRNEVNQLNIYKRMAGRMEEVDKLNLDLKNTISQFKDEVKEKERIIRQKELEIINQKVCIEHRNREIKNLKDKIVELEGEITHQKNIKVDLMSKIDKISTELERCKEELDDRNKRLEYAEQINFNEYSNDDLNFDLSERIKLLEEQNEELKKNQDHKANLVIEELETKLDELESEKKELSRVNQKTQIKYERYEKEREAKLLAKEKIKLLQKELSIALLEK
jgi:chromosome segregation ATPase